MSKELEALKFIKKYARPIYRFQGVIAVLEEFIQNDEVTLKKLLVNTENVCFKVVKNGDYIKAKGEIFDLPLEGIYPINEGLMEVHIPCDYEGEVELDDFDGNYHETEQASKIEELEKDLELSQQRLAYYVQNLNGKELDKLNAIREDVDEALKAIKKIAFVSMNDKDKAIALNDIRNVFIEYKLLGDE